MKRILSVILSLALLASALIIPMSVSADNTPMDPTEAYNQLNAAVDGLELDLDNIHPLQIANPDRSITAQGNYAESGTVSSVSDVSDGSLTSILGSKSVKISANNTTTGNSNGLIPGHVHAVEYSLTSDTNRIFARDIGYIVLYVQTNRSFKMSLGVHDNATGTPNIINGDKAVSVSAADDKYQAVAFNLTSVDWVNGNGVYYNNNYNHRFYANRMYLSNGGVKWYYPSIQAMTDDKGDIATTDNIVFGSIFYVPVDTNVRNFKFNYDITDSDVGNRTISQRFTELTADMIIAAEKITNDDGRYTAESFAALQTAVSAAKELLGITTVPVVKELIKTIGITETLDSDYTLNAALVGENVSFTLTDKPAGVDVTVKYGDVEIEPDGDVYTITVEKGKELHIIPSHVPKQFSKSEAATYFNADDSTRVSDDLSPVIFVTYEENDTQVRKQVGYKANYETNIPALSDGNISVKNDITVGDYFNGTNGYTSDTYTDNFKFKNNNNITNYVDIIYDLGCTVNVNKIQHFAANGNNSLGLYQVYAAEDVNNLFKDESWVLNYQNKQVSGTYYGCQQHEFVAKPARFVAFRILCPVTVPSNTANTLRIFELAIYGTKVGTDPGYTVTPVPDFNGWISGGSETGNVGDNNLLKLNNLTVNGKGDGKEVELKVSTEKQGHLHNGVYGGHRTGFMDAVHADINLVQFYDLNSNQFKNGYNISRDANGNITFEQTGPITDYVCMTYDLGDYYKLKEFQLYSANGGLNYNFITKMQAYEVYVGTDKETLYEDVNRVAKYDNYFNVYGQVIKFTNPRTGCYLGVKVLMPSMYANTNNYIRLSEIAAFGDLVGEPTAESKLAPAELTSESGYIYNKNGESIYTNDTNGSERTALRLTVGYKSPKVPGGANASKIILANGAEAKVIERNVIAIAKSKYTSQGLSTLDIHTAGASVTTSTATSTDYPVSNYFKSEEIKEIDGSVNQKYRMAYGALNLNNISAKNKESQIVVRGRVVYEYQGEIYAVYSDIVGVKETVSAQSAFDQLPAPKPTWFN